MMHCNIKICIYIQEPVHVNDEGLKKLLYLQSCNEEEGNLERPVGSHKGKHPIKAFLRVRRHFFFQLWDAQQILTFLMKSVAIFYYDPPYDTSQQISCNSSIQSAF